MYEVIFEDFLRKILNVGNYSHADGGTDDPQLPFGFLGVFFTPDIEVNLCMNYKRVITAIAELKKYWKFADIILKMLKMFLFLT